MVAVNEPESVSTRRLRLSRPKSLEVVVRGHDVEVDLLDVARRAEPRHPSAKVNEKGSIDRMDGCCLACRLGGKAVISRVLKLSSGSIVPVLCLQSYERCI